MPKSPNQKLKMLYIKDYFCRFSDEQHNITVNMIINMLAQHNINAERKTIYSDIEQLRDIYGLDIITAGHGKYYLGERDFQLAETKMLVDMVSSSKFLTAKKSAELIKKLEKNASVYQAKEFSSQTFLRTGVKNVNEGIYRYVDEMFSAINNNCKIGFKYFHYGRDKNKRYSNGGDEYTVSPMALLINEDNYYLAAYDGQKGTIRHFRADRMENVHMVFGSREGTDKFDAQEYSGESAIMFSMYNGESKSVTLRLNNSLSNVVIDRFGKSALLVPYDNDSFDVKANIKISPQFFGWIFGLGGEAEIVSPTEVREQYLSYLNKEISKY